MPKFRVVVTEEITARYDPVIITAANAEKAMEIAEEMRVQGGLGAPVESIDEVYCETSAD